MNRSLAIILLACVACSDKTVLAEVGKERVHLADLRLHGGAAPEVALQALVDRALLAEGARRRGLLDDALVRARVDAAAREALAQALLDQEVSLSEEELRRLYQANKPEKREVHVAEIFLKLPKGDPGALDEARVKAQRLYGRAVQGESFEKLVREASQDPVSAARGGDLGPLQEGQVDPIFFSAAVVLKKGEIAKPLDLGFGLFILQALDEPRTASPTFEQARGALEVRLRGEREAKLLAALKQEIRVELHPDRLPRK